MYSCCPFELIFMFVGSFCSISQTTPDSIVTTHLHIQYKMTLPGILVSQVSFYTVILKNGLKLSNKVEFFLWALLGDSGISQKQPGHQATSGALALFLLDMMSANCSDSLTRSSWNSRFTSPFNLLYRININLRYKLKLPRHYVFNGTFLWENPGLDS